MQQQGILADVNGGLSEFAGLDGSTNENGQTTFDAEAVCSVV
jgi:hypothetical protein